jgi:glycerol-3-phosphate dehydrogenase
MKSEQADILIVGAGVVGCAIARQCAQDFPGKKIIVAEKNSKPGQEATGHNSAVLHSGIHEDPALLKSKLARRGNVLAEAYINQHNLPMRKTGMIIAVPRKEPLFDFVRQLWILLRLIARGWRSKIPLKILWSGNVSQYEPDIKITAGIMMPNVYIIDPLKFTNKLCTDAEDEGVMFNYDSPVTSILHAEDKYTVTAGDAQFICGTVINAAGLYADDVAVMAGFDQYKIYPWRGEYYQLVNSDYKVSRPINPVMPRHHGKGIQIFPHIDGSIYIGPNSYGVSDKNDYTSRQTDPHVFLKAAQRFLPNVTANNLEWSYAGIRPKLNADFQETDFIIRKDSNTPVFINIIGIESPGLTSAMAIAEVVVGMVHK